MTSKEHFSVRRSKVMNPIKIINCERKRENKIDLINDTMSNYFGYHAGDYTEAI